MAKWGMDTASVRRALRTSAEAHARLSRARQRVRDVADRVPPDADPAVRAAVRSASQELVRAVDRAKQDIQRSTSIAQLKCSTLEALERGDQRTYITLNALGDAWAELREQAPGRADEFLLGGLGMVLSHEQNLLDGMAKRLWYEHMEMYKTAKRADDASAAMLRQNAKLLKGDADAFVREVRTLGRVGQALNAVGFAADAYSGFQGSAATTTGGRFVSGGLNGGAGLIVATGGAAATPLYIGFDVATGGGASAATDMYAVAAEDAYRAATEMDSSHLFGEGAQSWHDQNLSGENGWFFQNLATTGEWIAEDVTDDWDFLFDGDGSINWTPFD